MVDGLKISAQRDPGSLLRELRVAASAAGHAIPVLREEHARPALRTVRPLPRDAIPVDLVELPLESRDALFLLRLGHHLPPFFFGSAFFSSFGASFFSAAFFSLTSGSISLLRTRMCLRSTARASSFVL